MTINIWIQAACFCWGNLQTYWKYETLICLLFRFKIVNILPNSLNLLPIFLSYGTVWKWFSDILKFHAENLTSAKSEGILLTRPKHHYHTWYINRKFLMWSDSQIILKFQQLPPNTLYSSYYFQDRPNQHICTAFVTFPLYYRIMPTSN